MKIDTAILLWGQDVVPYSDFMELAELIEKCYQRSSHRFLMWKMLQFGYVFGKQAERARRKKK